MGTMQISQLDLFQLLDQGHDGRLQLREVGGLEERPRSGSTPTCLSSGPATRAALPQPQEADATLTLGMRRARVLLR